MLKKFIRRPLLKNTVLNEHEQPVQSGLAVTPSLMLDMTAKGIPIAPQNLGIMYEEGYSAIDFDVAMDRRRGLDMNDLWEEREKVHSKMRSPAFKELLKKGE